MILLERINDTNNCIIFYDAVELGCISAFVVLLMLFLPPFDFRPQAVCINVFTHI